MNLFQTLAMATGPVRLRSSLRRLTAPVRTVPATSVMRQAVANPLPPSVYGGDLLDLFSERLRQALPAPAASPVGRTRRRKARNTPPAPALQTAPWSGAIGEGPLHFARSAPAPEDARKKRNGSPAAHFLADDAPRREKEMPEAVVRPTKQVQEHRGGELTPKVVRTGSSAHVMPLLPGHPASVRPSVLEKQLATYWAHQIDPPAAPMLRPEDVKAPAPAAQPRSNPAPAPPATPPDWPSLTAGEARRALTRHLDSRRDPLLTLADSQQHEQQPGRVEIQNVFHVAAPPPAQAPPEDFAQTLADVLREQTRRHGIDVGVGLP